MICEAVVNEHFRPWKLHCRQGFRRGRHGKIEVGGFEDVGAEGVVIDEGREVAGAASPGEEALDGSEAERRGVKGIVRVRFGRV